MFLMSIPNEWWNHWNLISLKTVTHSLRRLCVNRGLIAAIEKYLFRQLCIVKNCWVFKNWFSKFAGINWDLKLPTFWRIFFDEINSKSLLKKLINLQLLGWFAISDHRFEVASFQFATGGWSLTNIGIVAWSTILKATCVRDSARLVAPLKVQTNLCPEKLKQKAFYGPNVGLTLFASLATAAGAKRNWVATGVLKLLDKLISIQLLYDLGYFKSMCLLFRGSELSVSMPLLSPLALPRRSVPVGWGSGFKASPCAWDPISAQTDIQDIIDLFYRCSKQHVCGTLLVSLHISFWKCVQNENVHCVNDNCLS